MQSKTLRQVYKNAYEEAVLKYRLNPPAKTKTKKDKKTQNVGFVIWALFGSKVYMKWINLLKLQAKS